MADQVEILLASGLHPNEACAPLTARQVLGMLQKGGVRAALYEIPYSYTLLALIDDPAIAATEYSMPGEGRELDVDLDGLDEELGRRHPGAIVFEFHNAVNTHPMLGIDPGKSVAEYEVGVVGPEFVRPYEIGTWRNIDRLGRPGKYLIELPACYTPVEPFVAERRRRRIEQLRAAGRDYNPQWLHYLETSADVEASRRKGYLDDCLARKVADWIMSRPEADR